MNTVDIAIIDSKINTNLSDELYKQVLVTNENYTYGLHGTLCYLVLKKFSNNSRISNYEILSTNENGKVKDLITALKWCQEEGMLIANLSFGTTHFLDKEKIKKVINEYANKGIIFVVSGSNDFFSSYPSQFSSVIGVANNALKDRCIHKTAYNNHIGIDVFAPSVHEVDLCGTSLRTEICNSFATPYISSVVGNLLLKNNALTIKEIKQILSEGNFYDPFIPDWICKAYIYGTMSNTTACLYFKEVQDVWEADTIILCDGSDHIDNIDFDGNHCVDLVGQSIDKHDKRFFYWCVKNREHQIKNSMPFKCDLDIPVIDIAISSSEDVLYFLSELKILFSYRSYNAYVSSTIKSCSLYNLEFIPSDFLLCKNEYIKNFFYWETYYNQSDILIISNDINVNKNLIDVDIMINIIKLDNHYRINIGDQDKHINDQFTCDDLNKDIVKQIYKKILYILLNNK